MQDNLEIAARIAGDAPGLLLAAERTARTFMRGVHGRRRVGQGETFWQFRPYAAGDSTRDIDWRQTAKRDSAYVRQLEWEASQALWLYRDASASMDFRSSRHLHTKKDFAEIVLLALAMLALNGGEQVSLLGANLAPQAHANAIRRIYEHLPDQARLAETGRAVAAHGHVVLISDFYMPVEELALFCNNLAARRVSGTLVQLCDPAEETLPFHGRVRFFDPEDSSAAPLTVQRVEAIRVEYTEKFVQHREKLMETSRAAGWRFLAARTDERPEAVLARLYDLLAAEGR